MEVPRRKTVTPPPSGPYAAGMTTDAVGAATGVDRVQRRVVRLLSITQVLGGIGSAAASRSAA
jgi:hypothetical protein